LVASSAVVLGFAAALPQQEPKPTYQNEKAPIQERVRDLLGRMTLEEKVAQLQSGVNMPSFGPQASSLFNKDQLNEAAVKQTLGNGLGTYAFLDEFMSMSPGRPRDGATRRNLLQAWVMKNTRLGIPIMFHGEALHGSVVKGATSFPQAIALGSTWDPDLLKQMFGTVAQEARTAGKLGIGFVPWGPMGMGYLTQNLDAKTTFDPKSDLRSGFDRFQPESIAANKPFVDRIAELAKRKDATTAQLSLAWLLAQKPFVVPIPGTGKVKHLEENIETANLVTHRRGPE
jgi:hypothetical protein